MLPKSMFYIIRFQSRATNFAYPEMSKPLALLCLEERRRYEARSLNLKHQQCEGEHTGSMKVQARSDRLWGGAPPARAPGVQGEGQQAGGAAAQGTGFHSNHPVAVPFWQGRPGSGAEQCCEHLFISTHSCIVRGDSWVGLGGGGGGPPRL